MRFVMQFAPPWVYELAGALEAGDMDQARQICIRVSTQAPVTFNQDGPFDHAMRLVVAKADNNLIWLEEAEAFLAASAGRWKADTEVHESVVTAYYLAGVMRLPDPRRAMAHFESALSMAPDFLPAKIELEILRSGRDRGRIFGALGVEAPRTPWAYKLAASELGMAPHAPIPAPPQGAICLRGLCTEHTPALVKLYRWLNPTTPIFVATWRDTPREILQAISENAHVALAPEPEIAGSQNKNRQIVLARAALLTAKFANISHALLVRTDMALFRAEIISNLESTYRSFPSPPSASSGRLIVSDIFTRKFLWFHISDLLAYGALPDLIRHWSAPFEAKGIHNNTEQYLGNHLYNSLGINYDDSITESYYKFVRDYFIIRDLSWFDGCWLKRPELRTAATQAFGDACISQLDWERLYHAPPSRALDAMSVGEGGVVIQAALGISRF
jgi:hypothetical protein